jgi:endogenous inhibitor of DNA gyrase (YacG/DUF329 family)
MLWRRITITYINMYVSVVSMVAIPTVRCTNCKKAVNINESILFNGKPFCSEACKTTYLNAQAKK